MESFGLNALVWFGIVLVMIPVVLRLLKRTPMGGGATQGLMRSVSVLPLSTNQRILTVEVGHGADRQWLVLGITASNITTLHTMAPQSVAPPASVNPTSPFAQLLGKLRRGQKPAGEQ